MDLILTENPETPRKLPNIRESNEDANKEEPFVREGKPLTEFGWASKNPIRTNPKECSETKKYLRLSFLKMILLR